MRWQPEEENLLRILISTNSHAEIAEEFRRRYEKRLPGFRTLRSYDSIRKKCVRDTITPESTEDYREPYSERWDKIKELISEYQMEAEDRLTGVNLHVTRKILALSDLHFPFALEDEIKHAMDTHSDADMIVFNGDSIDGYIFSTFGKARRVAALKEYQAFFELVKEARERFSVVVLVDGNHDIRPAQALARNDFEREASEILRPNLLARIANGEELDDSGELIELHNFGNVIYEKFDSWYVRIGKTIFCHPRAYRGSYPGGTVTKLYEYFTERLDKQEFDAIVVGHTHRQYKGVVNNCLLIEQGAMSARMPYQHKDDLRFKHAMNGYAVIYQDEDGNTDFNMSEFVHLGSQLPPKKDALL